MPDTTEEIQSKVLDLTVEAFSTFAEDIETMFDTEVTAQQSDITEGTPDDLKDAYKKLAAVCSVTAEGAVNGEFHIIFDKDGVFTLPGTFVMQPEQVILQNRKSGKQEEAQEIGDALAEVGNLLVGAWDRIFREELEGHKHFVQSGTFIGNVWANTEESLRIKPDEELSILSFEMTVAPLPPFNCSVIYPKSVFEPVAEAPSEEAPPEAEAPAEETPAEETPAEETPAEEAPAEEAVPQAEVSAEEPKEAQDKGPVTEAISKMAESPAYLPGDFSDVSGILSGLKAKDVMRKQVSWATAEATVEDLVAKMQQDDTGYIMIGDGEKLQGIVSKSDVRGAMSPYLQSMFAKWRSSMDVATLQIKSKWVMSRPVRTVTPEASLQVIVQTMTEHGGRCTPVVDTAGKVVGTITVFDVFYALLNCSTASQSAGRAVEAPPLA
ncbi:MAG: CBS domain-containing protein [Planctomycetes bacterium]|nr:CBS domain-containing protein [Planctomycetota bacterium]